MIFIMITAFGSNQSAVEALKLGAANYVLKPFNNDELRLVVSRALGVRSLEKENERLKRKVSTNLHFGLFVGDSPSMLEVYEMIRRVSQITHQLYDTGSIWYWERNGCAGYSPDR